MIVVGIDPGLTGALSFVDTATGAVVIEDMPTKERSARGEVSKRVDGLALATLVRRHVPPNTVAMSACEAVRSFGRSDPARAATVDSLQMTLGAIMAVFDVLRCPCVLVEPRAWQKLAGIVGKAKEAREKGALPAAVLKARELYPAAAPMLGRVKDHNRAESLLIAHFAVRTLT